MSDPDGMVGRSLSEDSQTCQIAIPELTEQRQCTHLESPSHVQRLGSVCTSLVLESAVAVLAAVCIVSKKKSTHDLQERMVGILLIIIPPQHQSWSLEEHIVLGPEVNSH